MRISKKIEVIKNVVTVFSTSTFYSFFLLLQSTYLTTFNGNFKCFKFTLSRLWSTGIYVVPGAGPAVLYVDLLSIVGYYLSDVILYVVY
jgi:hypothetical protein